MSKGLEVGRPCDTGTLSSWAGGRGGGAVRRVGETGEVTSGGTGPRRSLLPGFIAKRVDLWPNSHILQRRKQRSRRVPNLYQPPRGWRGCEQGLAPGCHDWHTGVGNKPTVNK